MTFRYVIRYRKGIKESVSVEAWPISRDLALPGELKKPSFIIGKVLGTRSALLGFFINELIKKYGRSVRGKSKIITLPLDNIDAISDAYRLGLAAAAISVSSSDEVAAETHEYIMKCTREEIWFWTSKFLNVITDGAQVTRVVEALCLIGIPNSRIEKNYPSYNGQREMFEFI